MPRACLRYRHRWAKIGHRGLRQKNTYGQIGERYPRAVQNGIKGSGRPDVEWVFLQGSGRKLCNGVEAEDARQTHRVPLDKRVRCLVHIPSVLRRRSGGEHLQRLRDGSRCQNELARSSHKHHPSLPNPGHIRVRCCAIHGPESSSGPQGHGAKHWVLCHGRLRCAARVSLSHVRRAAQDPWARRRPVHTRRIRDTESKILQRIHTSGAPRIQN